MEGACDNSAGDCAGPTDWGVGPLRGGPQRVPRPLPYARVTTMVPILTCGHSCKTSLLYMRMQP